jgi:hypothetical protein
MVDRRRGKRLRSWFVVRLDSEAKGGWLAMTRNMSLSGAMVATASRLEVGQTVTLTFKVPPDFNEERTVGGTIVRVQPNAEDPDGLWPHRVAVEFSEEHPEVEPRLARDSETWDWRYLLEVEEGDG